MMFLQELFWFLRMENVCDKIARDIGVPRSENTIDERWQHWVASGGAVNDQKEIQECVAEMADDDDDHGMGSRQ